MVTPEERAEKIHKETGCKCEAPKYCACVSIIAAQIRAAVEEAQGPREKPPCGHDADCDCLKARWKAEAYEDAAKIADQTKITRNGIPEFALTALGNLIRARAKETK